MIKKTLFYKMSCYPEPDSHSRNKTKFELDLSNKTKKIDVKNVTGVNTSNFAKKKIYLV